jgi:hypothetical protein
MAEMEEVRLEALKGLTILAMHDPQFRRGAVEDLEGTLSRYGYDLNYQEIERLRRANEEIAGMSDEDLVSLLSDGEQRVRVLSEEEERVVTPEEYVRLGWM